MSSSPKRSSAPAAARRAVTWFFVVMIHAGLVLGPLWFFDLFEKRKPKQEMFRVKIGGKELSKGPMVGMPERVPPRPPAPPEPEVPFSPPKPPPAEPRIPVVKPKPKPPKPKAVKKAKPKTVKKAVPKAKPKAVKKKVKPAPKKTVKPRPEPRVPVKKKTVKKKVVRRDPMDDVYKDPNPPNLNPRVPVGTANRAQKYAPKPDNRPPGGGRKTDEAALVRYGKNVERYIYSRWTEPPRSLLGGTFPETVIEVTIEASGKVSAARVVRSSGNRSMEASVQALLAGLDLLPRPPEGSITFRITLKTR